MKIKLQRTIYMLSRYFLQGLVLQMLFLNFVLAVNVNAQYKKIDEVLVTLDRSELTLDHLFKQIEAKTDFQFSYDRKDFDTHLPIKVETRNASVEEYLKQAAQQAFLSFRQVNHNIDVKKSKSPAVLTPATINVVVSGIVRDQNGESMPGVTVSVVGTTIGMVTDLDGRYSLSVPDGSTLVFSFVGFVSQTIEVGDRSLINVTLLEDMTALEEVVVIGYGSQKKEDIIGSIATISSEDIMKASSAGSFDAALQGMASGLMVSNSSGIPGAPVQVKVRGINSISSGTDPLWIVDGIPIASDPVGSDVNGASSQNMMSLINPNDIESIQVLKDAAATSIYGSRGSNGVILVTTKSGSKETKSFNVDVKTGVSTWANRDIKLASGAEYIQIMDKAYANSKFPGQYDPQTSLNQLDGVTSGITREEALATNTDWGDVISRTGSFVDANISASQGQENGNSFMSLRYRKDYSNLRHNNMELLSANANLNYKVLDRLNLNYRGFVSYSNNNRSNSEHGTNGAGGWSQINAYSLPWMKVYDSSGAFWNPLSNANALAGISPVNMENNLQTLNLLQGLTGSLKILEGLTLHGGVGINLVYDKALSYRSAAIRIDGAQAEEDKNQRTILNYNSYFNYDKYLNEDHWINVVAGVENTRSHVHYTHLNSQELIGEYKEVGRPESIRGRSYLSGESYLRGFFGRGNYKFKEKYIVGVSARRDGISKFTPENRWATFFSGSAGWIISEEQFFNSGLINLLKLRGSLGQTGNTNIPSGITTDNYQVRTGSTLGIPSTELISIGNSDIKWETTNSLDAGFDFGLLENRINGSVAYYRQKVEDMLLAVALPYSAGISGGNIIWQNVGDMENQGIEFNVDAAVLVKDFKWNLGFNFSTNNNKVLALDPVSDSKNVGFTQIEPYEDRVITIFKTGLPVGNWYMAESAGVDPERGIPMIYEVRTNEDGSISHTGKIIPATTENMEANRMILEGKTSLPKFIGGFNNQFSFKNFDLNMHFSFATGHYIYNRLLQSTLTPNRGMRALSSRLLSESWQSPGDNAKWPQVVMNVQYFYDSNGDPTDEPTSYGTEEKYISSMFLERGDYLKLNNLNVGYTFPSRVTSKLSMKSMRLSLSATNIFTLTKFSGYNPEVPIDQSSAASFVSYQSMPQSRTFSLGLNISL